MDRLKNNDVYRSALLQLFQEGSIALPIPLLTMYKKLGLTEEEVMLIIQIMVYQEKEKQPLPSVEKIATKMNLSTEQIAGLFKKLIHQGFLEIVEEINDDGLRCERYSLDPLYAKLADGMLAKNELDESENRKQSDYENLFQLFEREFGRPLSPFECEHLTQWLDQDGYSEELIKAAVREAVFCGKLNFRYIDRILLEWQRNRIRTADEAAEYAKRFRQKGTIYSSFSPNERKQKVGFSFYNWVNQE